MANSRGYPSSDGACDEGLTSLKRVFFLVLDGLLKRNFSTTYATNTGKIYFLYLLRKYFSLYTCFLNKAAIDSTQFQMKF